MGFDFDEKRSLLYADLFKLEEGHHGNNGSRRRSPASNCSSSSESSSSGFATPFGSEQGSSESDDGDFAAELSRQMAECMLHEEEEDERNSATESSYELSSNDPVLDRTTRTPCIKMKNQFPVGVWRGGRVKGGELTQRVRTEQNYGRYRGGGRGWRGGAPAGRNGHSGSGMQAVFLGGPGSTNGLSGTGVFLPRATNNSVQQKKKPGLSTVLIPTRVLEAIELHFKRHSDSGWTAGSGSPQHASLRDEWMTSKVHTMEGLPQEWTY